MAESSWPNSAHNGRTVTDIEYQHLHPFASDGVFGAPSDSSVVYADGTGLQVKIRAGKRGIVRGHAWYSGTTDFTVAVDANPGSQARTDIIVLRLNRSDWTVSAQVRKGTPGAGPPTLIRQAYDDTGIYEIPLADITIPGNATTILAGNLKQRPYWLDRICTSTTRPLWAAPGEVWYESDTGRWIGWSAAINNWVVIAPVTDSTAWANLTLAGPNWRTAGGPNDAKRINGIVHVRMNVVLQTDNGSGFYPEIGTNGVLLATIPANPAGLRPVGYTANTPVNGTGNVWGRLDINDQGRILLTHTNADVHEGRTFRACFSFPLS